MNTLLAEIRRYTILLILAPVVMYGSVASAAEPPLDPGNYLSLDEKQLGHIRHMVKLSKQLPGDWSGMDSNWWNVVERSLQYQLAFMAYAMTLAQYHYTPAYYELYRDAIDSFIQKILLPDTWQTWALTSRGGTATNPDQKELYEGSIDPVAKGNVMYSGHVLQMAALYEMFYREHKYDQPGSISFDFNTSSWGFGRQIFEYDLHKLTRAIYEQFKDSGYAGITCEPNLVFPECNQHPVLGFMHYDFLYGTRFARDVMPKFKAVWLGKGYTNPNTKSYMLLRLQQQDEVKYRNEAWSDGWTGTFMHAWDKAYVESLYPFQRDRHFNVMLYGKNSEAASEPTAWEKRIGFGQFAILAAEVGDLDTRDEMLEYADRYFAPVWRDGRYYYPRNDDMTRDERGIIRTVDALAGNALLPMARLNVPDGIWALYNHPWPKDHHARPYITGVDTLTTSVSQAVYVQEKEALLVTLVPGPVTASRVSFVIANLSRDKSYAIWKDGEPVGSTSDSGTAKNAGLQVDSDGKLVIETTLSTPHTFILAEESGPVAFR